MDPYELLWMVLLIVFVLGELATIGLTCIWFAAGALAALVMAMAGINPVVQFLVFFVVSILLLAATRPWARKYVNAKMQRTNADSLIGENIRISERVSNMDQTGMAVVHGQEWTVRTRYVLEECYFHRKKYAEVAENIGISINAVKKHIMKALNLLREEFRLKTGPEEVPEKED